MLQFLANGLCKGAVIALMGLGFGLIYTTTRVFHLAHAGVYVLAGYCVWLALNLLTLPLVASVLFALALAAAAGVLIDWTVYQPLARRLAPPTVVLISSLGVLIAIENSVALAFGNQSKILGAGLARSARLGPVVLTYVQLSQLLVGVVVTAVFWLFLKHTQTGRVCRAVADDESLALVLGIRVSRVRFLAMAIGSALAGASAILVALDVGIDPNAGLAALLAGIVAYVIGGFRSFVAPAAGGFLLGVLQSLVVWRTQAKWEAAVTFGLLVFFLSFRKQGLFGVSRRVEEA